MKDQSRNLNPHKSAVAAMWLFSIDYAAQSGGSMDFWESLSEHQKNLCRRMVSDIEKAQQEQK